MKAQEEIINIGPNTFSLINISRIQLPHGTTRSRLIIIAAKIQMLCTTEKVIRTPVNIYLKPNEIKSKKDKLESINKISRYRYSTIPLQEPYLADDQELPSVHTTKHNWIRLVPEKEYEFSDFGSVQFQNCYIEPPMNLITKEDLESAYIGIFSCISFLIPQNVTTLDVILKYYEAIADPDPNFNYLDHDPKFKSVHIV